MIPKDEYTASHEPQHMVMGDIKPYKSMVTGEIIEGRKQHREHLKTHNVVEVGDAFDKPTPKPYYTPDKGLKERIARQVYEKLRY